MGFFSSLGKIAGVVAGVATGNPVAALGSLADLGSASDARSQAKRNVEQANAFTKEQLQNRHQWEVMDLKAAGLNPILSAGGVPSIGASPVADVVPNPTGSANSAMQIAAQKKQMEAIDSSIALNKASALKAAQDAATSADQAALIRQQAALTNQQTRQASANADEAEVTRLGYTLARDHLLAPVSNAVTAVQSGLKNLVTHPITPAQRAAGRIPLVEVNPRKK